MKYILFGFVGFLLAITGHASIIDSHCRSVSIKEDSSISVKKDAVVFLHNVGSKKLWVTHPVKEASASAGWASELDPKRWSGLYLPKSEGSFALACVQSEPGHEQHVPCSSTLQICVLTVDKKPKTATSAFWAVENQAKSALLPGLGQRGFEWPSKKEAS